MLLTVLSSEATGHSVRLEASTHPSALPSDELVVFGLDAGSAAGVVVLLLKVRVVLQLLWGLQQQQAAVIRNSLPRMSAEHVLGNNCSPDVAEI